MIVALISALAAPARMVAQGSPTGTLTGTVSDPTGAVLPGVTVAVKSVQTGMTQQTTTGTNGEWRIPALPVGTYEVSFELQGFKRLVRDGIIVEAAATRSVPASLAVGGLAETVNVTGDANLLSTTTVTTVRSITRRRFSRCRHPQAASPTSFRPRLASAPTCRPFSRTAQGTFPPR